jgi:hypothetical protein
VVATTGNPAATTALAVATSQAFGSRRGAPGRCSDRSRSHRLWRSVVCEGATRRLYAAVRAQGVRLLEAVRRGGPPRRMMNESAAPTAAGTHSATWAISAEAARRGGGRAGF